MKERWIAFSSGLVFSIGLALSGMTRPGKVLGFLDVTGDWDASLAFVMMGAVGLNLIFFRRILARRAPILGSTFHLPAQRRVDARLIIGSAMFGVGWGIAGYCPGPAVASIVSGHVEPLLFVGAMLAGFVAQRWTEVAGSDASVASAAVPEPR